VERARQLQRVVAIDEAEGRQVGETVDLIAEGRRAFAEIADVEVALAQNLAGGDVRLLEPRSPELAGRLVEIALMTEEAFGVVAGVVRQRPDDLVSVHGHAELLVDTRVVDVRRLPAGKAGEGGFGDSVGYCHAGIGSSRGFSRVKPAPCGDDKRALYFLEEPIAAGVG
jgi:hypothetical protein